MFDLRSRGCRVAGAAALLAAAATARADYALNMHQGVTPISHEVYHLHMLILYICCAIGVVVFGTMFYSIINHRKSKGAVAAQFHESTTVEIIWTIIPFVILISMAIPATKTLLAMEDTRNADVTIKVTGYQWKWGYDYLNDGVSSGAGPHIHFLSTLSTPKEEIYNHRAKGENYLLEVDHPLVVPVGRKVRLEITAADVIHSWWVPDLGMKKDAIPGYVNQMWLQVDKPGTYRGQCAELCGKDHGFMPIVVVAKNEADYERWVHDRKRALAGDAAAASKTWTRQALMAKGAKVYQANCAACHQANGGGLPGTFPALNGSKVVNGPLAQHLQVVLKGRPGTAMQSFAGQLSDTEIAAVITYERNSWDNHTGDLVQPAMVKAAR